MKKELRTQLASAAFNNEYNCAQAVLMAFPEALGENNEAVIKQAVGFGGGMGRLQEICGAVSGGAMVIGLKYGSGIPDKDNKESVYSMVQELALQFSARWGTIKCSDLLGVDLKTDEGKELHSSLHQKENICHKCVATVVEIVNDIKISNPKGGAK